MNAIHQSCPQPGRLAAWIDGRLAAEEREELLAHVHSCRACAELVTDVLVAQGKAEPTVERSASSHRWRWAIAAALLAGLGSFAAWLGSDAGEKSYLRALTSVLRAPGQAEAVLCFHPPSSVPTAGLAEPPVLRGGPAPAPCAPGTDCGEALGEALRKSGSPLRLRLDPEAARIFLATSALDPETAYRAEATIRENVWTRSPDPSLRVAAALVLVLAGIDDDEETRATVAELDPARIEDPATLYNLAKLAQQVGDFSRECAAWRAYLARSPTGPWANAARRAGAGCPHL